MLSVIFLISYYFDLFFLYDSQTALWHLEDALKLWSKENSTVRTTRMRKKDIQNSRRRERLEPDGHLNWYLRFRYVTLAQTTPSSDGANFRRTLDSEANLEIRSVGWIWRIQTNLVTVQPKLSSIVCRQAFSKATLSRVFAMPRFITFGWTEKKGSTFPAFGWDFQPTRTGPDTNARSKNHRQPFIWASIVTPLFNTP